MLFVLASFLALSRAQQSECVYRVGNSPIELNLYSLKGQRFLLQDDDGSMWGYSPCNNGFACSHGGLVQASMVDHEPQGINECFTWATLDYATQPFYDFQIGAFIFNYSNGEPCPDGTQINRTTTILWTCDPDRGTPRMVDAYNYDTCNVMLEIKWEGACTAAPPPDEACEYKSGLIGGPALNLSTVKGQVFTLAEQSNNGNTFYYEFSPCANAITCYSAMSGNSYQVMADVRDSGKQCAKYLGVWSGDNQPFYDRTVFGQDYWDFFWMDGEQCGQGGPLEILNVRYYCNQNVPTLNITRGYSNAPCQFRIEIDTKFACTGRNATSLNTIKRLNQHIFQ